MGKSIFVAISWKKNNIWYVTSGGWFGVTWTNLARFTINLRNWAPKILKEILWRNRKIHFTKYFLRNCLSKKWTIGFKPSTLSYFAKFRNGSNIPVFQSMWLFTMLKIKFLFQTPGKTSPNLIFFCHFVISRIIFPFPLISSFVFLFDLQTMI